MTNTQHTHLWQRNYYEHVIRDERDYQAIYDYILTNPQNWDKDEENQAIYRCTIGWISHEPEGGMMTNMHLQKHKCPQYFITILLIFSFLAGMLSSCDAVTNGVRIEITSTVENPATEELTLVPETEVATEMPTITLTSEPTVTSTEIPTATVEATSARFSKEYPTLWRESYTAKVGEMEIPIDIGLTYSIMHRPSEPITEIHIAKDVVDMVGDYFMHTCFWRYTQLMDHPDVTYEQYLELVAKGEGKVEFAAFDNDRNDQERAENTLVDPSKGFSLTFADEDFRINMNSLYSVDFINSQEKIIMISQIKSKSILDCKNGVDESVFDTCLSVDVLRSMEKIFYVFGGAENRCLILSTTDKSRQYVEFCGDFNPPVLLQNYKKPLENELNLRYENDGEDLFTVKQN